MTANSVDPADWIQIVERIRSGDPGVGAYLANRERRQDNYFSEFRYRPTITQSGGGSASYSTNTYARIFRIGTLVFLQFNASITPFGVTGTDPPIYFTLPQGYDQNAGPDLVGLCIIETTLLGYEFGGVTFNSAQKRLESFPITDPYMSPPVTGLDIVSEIGLICNWTLPDGLV